MCGLYGAVGRNLSHMDRDNVRCLAMMNTTRGIDSTGMAFMWRKANKIKYDTLVDTVDAFEFLGQPDVKELFKFNSLCMIMGHDRSATIGKVTEENAQPIISGRFIGCHNGTIDKFKPKKEEEDFVSDSRILFNKIDKDGLIPTLREADEGTGAFALTYYNMPERTLNFIRNYKRTLHGMWNKTGTCMYWSSEDWHLDVLRKRGNYSDYNAPFSIDPYKKCTLNLLTLKYTEERVELNPIIVVPRTGTRGAIDDVPWSDAMRRWRRGDSGAQHGSALGPELDDFKQGMKDAVDKDKMYPKRVHVLYDINGTPILPNVPTQIKNTTEKEVADHMKKYRIVLQPKSMIVSRMDHYKEWGMFEYFNDHGEFITRRFVEKDKPQTLYTAYKGYRGQLMTIPEATELVRECSCCSCVVDIEDEVYWIDPKEVFCAKCAGPEGDGHYFCHRSSMHKGEFIE